MDINDIIFEYYTYPHSYDDEDDESKKKSSFKKIVGGLALAGLGAGAVAASQTHAGQAIIDGVKSKYHSWRAKANLKRGNVGGAISHGFSTLSNGISAVDHYFSSPTLQKIIKI